LPAQFDRGVPNFLRFTGLAAMESRRTTSKTITTFFLAALFNGFLWQPSSAAADNGSKFIFDPWKKFCLRRSANVDEKMCVTGLNVRSSSGLPVASLTVISADSPPPKPVLRVTIPLAPDLTPVLKAAFLPDLKQGLTLAFDHGQPQHLQYTTCYQIGCLAEMESDPALIAALSDAHQIHLHVPRLMRKEALDITIPSEGFGAAYHAAYDFKAAEEAWRKQQEAHEKELAKYGEPVRKRIPYPPRPQCAFPALEQ
jgi:invasion protein IalB